MKHEASLSPKLETIQTIERLDEISNEWSSLAAIADHDTPYSLPHYLIPWLKRLGRAFDINFLAAWQGERLVGLAPVVERSIGLSGITLTFKQFPEVAPSPPCDILVKPGDQSVIDALFQHWLQNNSWDAIELANVPAGSTSLKRLKELALVGNLVIKQSECPAIHLTELNGTWEQHLQSRSKKFRQNLRRGRRESERLGKARYSHYPGDLTYQDAVSSAFHVLKRSWKNDTSSTASWNDFLAELLTRLQADDQLLLRFLMINDIPVAFVADMNYRNRIWALHTAYDLSYQQNNPGIDLLAHCQQLAFESPCSEYLTGIRPELRHLSPAKYPLVRLRIGRNSMRSRAKLRLFDWIHERRRAAAIEKSEQSKHRQKQQLRS